jgi:competence protein ComEC
MSFAATAALIAVYQALPTWLIATHGNWQHKGLFARLGIGLFRLLALTLLTSAVAGLATAPIAAYHFERVATYGLLGNLAVMPWFSFVVMPLIVMVLCLMPFGLEALPLWALNITLEPVFAIAHWVAHLPGALAPTGRLNGLAIAGLCFGGLVLMLMKGHWRRIGLLGLAAMLFISAPRYDVYVSGDGKSMMARMQDGDFARVPQRGSDFAYDVWLGHEGQGARLNSKSFRFRRNCKQGPCLLEAGFGFIAMADTAQSLCQLDNGRDLKLILLKQAEKSDAQICAPNAHIITTQDLKQTGALAMQAMPDGTFKTISARQTIGAKDWNDWQEAGNEAEELETN